MKCVDCGHELTTRELEKYETEIRRMVDEEYLSWAQATSLNPPHCRSCDWNSMSKEELRRMEAKESRDFYEEHLREYFC